MNKAYVRHNRVNKPDRLSIPLIKRCINTVLRLEGVGISCEVSVLVTDDLAIREINREFRGKDEPTDVLSFPMLELSAQGWVEPAPCAIDPETGLLPLGEIVLSAERVDRQAQEYGNSRDRETAYLTVHSVLHLLGYDHGSEPEEKARMRTREKQIMLEMGF